MHRLLLLALGLVASTAPVSKADEARELKLLTTQGFQREFDRQAARGFRPIDLALFTEQRTTRVAVIFAERSEPLFQVRVNVSAAEIQTAAKEFQPDGFQLVRVAVDPAGKELKYAGIWERRRTAAHVRLGFDPQQFNEARQKLKAEGSRPIDLVLNVVKGEKLYSAIWDGTAEPERVLESDLTSGEVTSAIERRQGDGFRLLDICGYPVGRSDRYACIWEKSDGPQQQVLMRQTSKGLTRVIKRLESQGFRPARVSAYRMGSGIRFAVVWDAKAE